MSSCQVREEGWEWSLVAEALEAAGLCPMKECIWRRKATIVEYIPNCQIYKLCMGADRIPGSSRFMRLWDQDLNPEEERDDASEGAER